MNWKPVVIIAVVLAVISVVFISFFFPPAIIIPEEDDADSLYRFYSPYITPNSSKVVESTQVVLGVNFDGTLSPAEVTFIQDWLSKRFIRIGALIRYPDEALNEKRGSDLSLHLLELSMFLSEENSPGKYLLLSEVTYENSSTPQDHSSVLVRFENKVFISDLTIPYGDLHLVCRLSYPVECIGSLVQNTRLTTFNVKYVLSEYESRSFKNNTQFIEWLLG